MENDAVTSTERLSRIRALLVAELSRSAELHERGCYEDLGAQFDAIDEMIWKLGPRRFVKTTLEYKHTVSSTVGLIQPGMTGFAMSQFAK
jgi:hypothetical protein